MIARFLSHCSAFILSGSMVFGQEHKLNELISEVHCSINQAYDYGKGKLHIPIGFGFGITKKWLPDRPLNVLLDFSYNHVRQTFKELNYEGHTPDYEHVRFAGDYFSISNGVRLGFGKKVRYFIQHGMYTEFVLNKKASGYYSDITSTQQHKVDDVHLDLQNSNLGVFTGIGATMPFAKHYLITSLDFRFGMLDLNNDGTPIYNRFFSLNLGYSL